MVKLTYTKIILSFVISDFLDFKVFSSQFFDSLCPTRWSTIPWGGEQWISKKNLNQDFSDSLENDMIFVHGMVEEGVYYRFDIK